MCVMRRYSDSCHIHPNRHRCDPWSFYPSTSKFVSPSYNPPSNYLEACKAGWQPVKRERQFDLLRQNLPSLDANVIARHSRSNLLSLQGRGAR